MQIFIFKGVKCRIDTFQYLTLKVKGFVVNNTEESSSAIKTPKQLVIVLLLSFIFPITIIVLLSQIASGGISLSTDDPALSSESIARRLMPVGSLIFISDLPKTTETLEKRVDLVTAAVSVTTTENIDKIQIIYTANCSSCHTNGIAGAPKLGDKLAWASRIQSGKNALYKSALKGKNAMPAKGGNISLSDADVMATVDYMVSQFK